MLQFLRTRQYRLTDKLGAVQNPLQQALVSSKTTLTLLSCQQHFISVEHCILLTSTVVAYDPEPADLARAPQDLIISEVMSNIAMVNDADVQPYMWHSPGIPASRPEDSSDSGNTFYWYFEESKPGNFFVSGVPNGTATGVLREHAMRLNSSAECSHINRSDFPAFCSGNLPLVRSFSGYLGISFDICAPGDYGINPWTLSRDRQELREEFYIDVHVPASSTRYGSFLETPFNFTVQCSAYTTRGYFEIPNYRNSYATGRLLDTWPDNVTIVSEFNDYLGVAQDFAPPQRMYVQRTLCSSSKNLFEESLNPI